MAGIDDNVAIIGDWLPPSPSTRAFFSSALEDVCSRPTVESENSGHREQMVSENSEVKDATPCGISSDQLLELSSYNDLKSNSHGSLVERMAARAGFNAPRLDTESIRSADLSLNSEVIRSPYFTIPPGLSPTTLLDSPVFLSNSLPSPTTGKLPFGMNGVTRSSMLMSDAIDKNKDNFLDDIGTSSFAFKPGRDLGSPFFLGAMATATLPMHSFPGIEASAQSENSLQSHSAEPSNASIHDRNGHYPRVDFSQSCIEKEYGVNTIRAEQRPLDTVGDGSAAHSPPLDEQPDEEGEHRGVGDSLVTDYCGAPAEDGYNWRKYGQKQVKGSEFPRSYYKCTHPNCQVKKKVERSHEGDITEIIYKGAHNHPKPPPNHRSAIGSSNPRIDMELEIPEQTGPRSVEDDPRPDATTQNLEGTSSVAAVVGLDYGNPSTSLQAQNGSQFESGDAVDGSSTFSNDDEEDEQATHGSVSLGYEGEGDESESKRRKIEAYATEMNGATRAIREPRVVVQTTSEVDILDDGYRWRKYGQKVVKGNPNPRSYYKCTNAGCTVRKHVERASHDLKSVITTYEGKHNHDVPAARNSGQINSSMPSAMAAQAYAAGLQTQVLRSDLSIIERSAPPGPFSLPGRQHLGPSNGFSFAMNQAGLGNLTMAGLGPGQSKLPVLPTHPYLAQHPQGNEMGFMLPKGEPKVEPISDPSLNLSNGSSIYQQIMGRLPLGHQM